MYKEDTIAAIATPAGEGGVAIVRVSGPDAEAILGKIFARDQSKNGLLRSHTLYHGSIREPVTDKILDEVLVTVMRQPHSYTGEDVVEVHCHGGVFVVRQVLSVIVAQGARHADPGEFTKRAFLNGRLDLSQAEAVLDLIRARTDKGVEVALSQVGGELSRCVGALREQLLDILVQVEAAIDFPEEEIELLQHQALIAKISLLIGKINEILESYKWGRLFREGAKVCICGRPNVGKSSLMNALLDDERVIVTPMPGTTRDVIEESLDLDGLPVALWDTAGIRDTEDQVEKIGVNLSLRHIDKADVVIVLLDGSVGFNRADYEFLALMREKKGLVVINKTDLPQELDVESLREQTGEIEILLISAKHREGIDSLRRVLKKVVLGSRAEPAIVINNLRHKSALEQSQQALENAVSAVKNCRPPEIISVDLQKAKESLEEIIGVVSSDDILERIFASFCIGK
jgi:tRNA modification GTPase